MAYSLDLRQKVLAALATESSSEVVAERFGISVAEHQDMLDFSAR